MMKLIILLILLLPSICFAQEGSTVEKITDDLKIHLTDKKTLHVAGVFVPKNLKNKAVDLLRKSWLNQPIQLVDSDKNRYSEYSVQVKSNGKWMQEELLLSGFAYLFNPDNLSFKKMQKAEATARNKKLGLWALDKYKIISDKESVEKMNDYKGRFKIVKGSVFGVKKIKDKIYINFGEDWKTDFTAMIRRKNFSNFEDMNFDKLSGKKVTVRGWLGSYNGPFIEIYHPNQIIF